MMTDFIDTVETPILWHHKKMDLFWKQSVSLDFPDALKMKREAVCELTNLTDLAGWTKIF